MRRVKWLAVAGLALLMAGGGLVPAGATPEDKKAEANAARAAHLAVDALSDTGAAHVHSESATTAAAQGQRNMSLLYQNATGNINSDIAFWGQRAFVGNYAGFRIFDIQRETPRLLADVFCYGPQNDISVYDRDGNGQADLLFLSVDQTLAGPNCGSPAVASDDVTGWEGIRIFDVTDPRRPRFLKAVYQDCGSHTHTLVPDPRNRRVLLYNASYPLRPGPTCGPVNGPRVGRSPVHGVIQVVAVPLDNPRNAREIAERPINYPGDPDNVFDPAEHGLPLDKIRACHDMAVFVPLRLVGAACAEQAQLWRIGPDMLPDTRRPLWVFDDNTDTDGPGGGDVAVDFWHSATFTWDGRIVNFSDESFGDGCPTVTPGIGDTGRTHFLRVSDGQRLSQFMIPRAEPDAYCSTHQGNVVAMRGRYLLAQAWYMGGVDLIDFTDPRAPREVAFYDAGPAGAAGSDNWAHYWYERRPVTGTRLATYGQDGFGPTGRGFEKFLSGAATGPRVGLGHLNPQTQERVLFR